MSILILLGAAFAGALSGFFAATRLRRANAPQGAIAALVCLAAASAAATYSTQRLLDSGLAFETVDLLERACYFAFGFCATAGWVLMKTSPFRWFLAALAPVALFEPLRFGIALVALGLKRLGLW